MLKKAMLLALFLMSTLWGNAHLPMTPLNQAAMLQQVDCPPTSKLCLLIFYDKTAKLQGSLKDREILIAKASEIAQLTGLTLETHDYERQELDEAGLRSAIDGLEVGSDDVLWTVYTGHGQNSGGDLPQFLLGNGTAVTQKFIHQKLKAKNARLTLTFYDCCNHIPPGATNSLASARNPLYSAVSKQLFRFHRGDVVAASSKAGEYSYGDELTGGQFIASFFWTLSRMSSVSAATWETLMEQTKVRTVQESSRNRQDSGSWQHPVAHVSTNATGQANCTITPENRQAKKVMH